MMIKGVFILHFFCGMSYYAYSQREVFFVEKMACSYMNRNSGFKLVLHRKNSQNDISSSVYSYDLEGFVNLNDTDKIDIIGKLLEFEGDTSLCCLNIIGHSFNGIEGSGPLPTHASKRFDTEIDALYMINRLCWPKLIELYSSYTLLYDTLERHDINQDPAKIKIAFEGYKQWYLSIKKSMKIPQYFPFNDGRFVWAGGRKSLFSKK